MRDLAGIRLADIPERHPDWLVAADRKANDQRSMVTDAVEPIVQLLAAEITAQAVPSFWPDSSGGRIVVTADTSDRTRDRFAQRAAAYALAIGTDQAPGWMTPSEVREAEGLDPSMPSLT